jgi:hypothetical protein
MSELPDLPPQRDGVPWPTEAWPEAPLTQQVDRERLERAADTSFSTAGSESYGETYAWVMIQRGELVFERYAPDRTRDETFHS